MRRLYTRRARARQGAPAPSPPPPLAPRAVFLTLQTNVLNFLYFSMATASYYAESAALDDAVVRFFPLSFASAALVTLLYYGLDHFNPTRIAVIAEQKAKGFP